MEDVLARLVKDAPKPGVAMSRLQLVAVAAEVDRVLADLSPGEREALLLGVLQRLSAGAPTPARDDLLLKAGKGLFVQQLARILAKPE